MRSDLIPQLPFEAVEGSDELKASGEVVDYTLSFEGYLWRLNIWSKDKDYLGCFFAPYFWAGKQLAWVLDVHFADNRGVIEKNTRKSREGRWVPPVFE